MAEFDEYESFKYMLEEMERRAKKSRVEHVILEQKQVLKDGDLTDKEEGNSSCSN